MIDGHNRTIWCGNLPEQISDEILYELFLQAGPLESVRIARDKNGHLKNFGFITYNHEVSVPYALNLLRGTTLYNKTITMQCRGRMAPLQPPIRCFGPDPSMDFSYQPNVIQQFAKMAQNLREREQSVDEPHLREQCGEKPHSRDSDDRLVIASLQGNWTHRHHPYRAREIHNRDNYRPRENNYHRNRDKPSGNWHDRHYKKPNYHRRE